MFIADHGVGEEVHAVNQHAEGATAERPVVANAVDFLQMQLSIRRRDGLWVAVRSYVRNVAVVGHIAVFLQVLLVLRIPKVEPLVRRPIVKVLLPLDLLPHLLLDPHCQLPESGLLREESLDVEHANEATEVFVPQRLGKPIAQVHIDLIVQEQRGFASILLVDLELSLLAVDALLCKLEAQSSEETAAHGHSHLLALVLHLHVVLLRPLHQEEVCASLLLIVDEGDHLGPGFALLKGLKEGGDAGGLG